MGSGSKKNKELDLSFLQPLYCKCVLRQMDKAVLSELESGTHNPRFRAPPKFCFFLMEIMSVLPGLPALPDVAEISAPSMKPTHASSPLLSSAHSALSSCLTWCVALSVCTETMESALPRVSMMRSDHFLPFSLHCVTRLLFWC